MKFEGSGSNGTRVIERKRSVTDGQTDSQTDRRTDGQGKNNMSPQEGERHNDYKETPIFKHCLKYHLDFYFDETMSLLDNGMS